jgi:HK97 family phage prohead protease
MSTVHANRAKILDVHETRTCTSPFEYREDKYSGKIIIEGYASTYEPYDVYGGSDGGGWTEQIEPRAFDVTLASRPDLMLLVNHEGLPLARTTAGNLQVTSDYKGLRVRAQLDPADPDVQRLMPKLAPQANGKAIMDQMSFGFRCKDQIWSNDYTHRTITELSLHKGDVSIVNYGANPSTSIGLSETVDALARLSRDDLVELRNAVDDDLAHRDDGDSKKPYGDVKYADPKNGKYPIDTEAHARAAWSYINMPKNQSGYTAGELSAIKGRIKAALKKFGVDVAEDKAIQFSAPAPGVTRADFLPTAPAGDPPDDDEDQEITPPGVEAFTPDNPMITVGQLAAAVSEAVDPHGVRSLKKVLADMVAVSLPPTLAP